MPLFSQCTIYTSVNVNLSVKTVSDVTDIVNIIIS
jgi:hypothetical protein